MTGLAVVTVVLLLPWVALVDAVSGAGDGSWPSWPSIVFFSVCIIVALTIGSRRGAARLRAARHDDPEPEPSHLSWGDVLRRALRRPWSWRSKPSDLVPVRSLVLDEAAAVAGCC